MSLKTLICIKDWGPTIYNYQSDHINKIEKNFGNHIIKKDIDIYVEMYILYIVLVNDREMSLANSIYIFNNMWCGG